MLVLLDRETEHLVSDTARLEVRDLDRRPDEGDLDTHADRVIGLPLQQCMHLFDTLCPLLGLQRHHQPIGGVGHIIGEIVGVELELARVLVRLVVLGIVDLHFVILLFLLDGIDRFAVVPRVHFGIRELALLALVPDGAPSLVDTRNVYVVAQRSPLLAEHLLVGGVEDTARLMLVGCFLGQRLCKRQNSHQHG